MKKILLILILIILFLIPGAAAFNIKADFGETYIKWQWISPDAYDIYIDGKLATSNTTIGYYYLTDLNPNEEHRLDLMEVTSTTPYKTSVLKTTSPAILIITMLVFCLIFSLVLLFIMEDEWKVLFLSGIIELIALFGRSISYNFFGADLIFLGFVVFAGVFLGIALYKIGRKEIAWY